MKTRKARIISVLFALAGAIGVTTVVICIHPFGWTPSSPPASIPMQQDEPLPEEADENDSAVGEPLPLGSRFGCNQPVPPPITFLSGPPRGESDTPDLSTPAVTVQTVLSLIDQAETEKLALCVLEEMDVAVSDLYPNRVGEPVGLVEVIEDGESARVVWEAAVHTEFSRRDKRWLPGETITLTAHLVQVEGLWKLLQLHEGEENDVPEQEVSAN